MSPPRSPTLDYPFRLSLPCSSRVFPSGRSEIRPKSQSFPALSSDLLVQLALCAPACRCLNRCKLSSPAAAQVFLLSSPWQSLLSSQVNVTVGSDLVGCYPSNAHIGLSSVYLIATAVTPYLVIHLFLPKRRRCARILRYS
ncbi:hypothetical protein K461DRAFT_7451 [Myriangium duriaei CBS 260.36]|uniref:Uncharacterized protein n=1 Tax=Myriangium duriaei CBS 260.36 TaxID=1168546 RepID=A0A9P4J7S9_9PEZI|nr:hypothetical protein K461DRAFT_7451 [Myriangium duriaei CBS 260.36]